MGVGNLNDPGVGNMMTLDKEGRIVLFMSKGKRQIYPNSEELTSDTVFDLASLTKLLTTTVTALSVFEKENISLRTEAGKFIPELANETAAVTLHQLFTHTSGLPPVPDIFRLFPVEDDIENLLVPHLTGRKPMLLPS